MPRNDQPKLSRRNFMCSTAAIGTTALVARDAMGTSTTSPASTKATSIQAEDPSLKERIFKTLKIGMVRIEGSLIDKFNAAKEAGFRWYRNGLSRHER